MTVDPNGFNAHWLRHASPYINQHRGRTFVFLLNGDVLDHPNAISILHDLVLLHSLGVRIVIVHGSRPQINAALANAKLQSQFVDGRRVTTKDCMPLVAQAVGLKRMKIEAHLTTDMEASPMRGAKLRVVSGNFIVARPIGIENGIDFAHSGVVRKVDKVGIEQALDNQNVVLVSHIGFSRTGEMFNLSCEEVASEVATALEADKLILFSPDEGIMDSQGLLRYLSPKMSLEKAKTSADSAVSNLLHWSAKAATGSVERVHVVSYTLNGALLKELFTRDGAGTLISEQELENLRDARTMDVGRLLHILSPLEQDGTLVKRSRKVLEQEMDRFVVIEKENFLIGCAALYPFPGTSAGELACLAVRPAYRNGARGARLLRSVEKRAKANGMDTLYVLTTKTAHWFIERGFVEIEAKLLPKGRTKPYNLQRNSKVFKKELT